MTQKRWISIDPATLDKKESSKVRGVEIIHGISPFDIPEAVCCFRSEHGDHIVLEFSYFGEGERTFKIPEGDGIVFLLGEATHRIKEIRLTCPKGLRDKSLVRPILHEGLRRIASDDRFGAKRRHFAATETAIIDAEGELMQFCD